MKKPRGKRSTRKDAEANCKRDPPQQLISVEIIMAQLENVVARSLHHTKADRTATHRKLDRRRVYQV